MTLTTEQQADIEKRVATGAAFLDEHHPGWHNEVNLETLELQSYCDCVLGQIVGFQSNECNVDAVDVKGYNYSLAMGYDAVVVDRAFLYDQQDVREALEDVDGLSKLVMSSKEATARGFHLGATSDSIWTIDASSDGSDSEWKALTDEWKRVIVSRRETS